MKDVQTTVKWETLADEARINKTIAALKENGIEAFLATSEADAKTQALAFIPEDSEVMTMTSVTLTKLDLEAEINNFGKYDAVKPKLAQMNRATESLQMQKLGSAPEYAIGSIHAVTEDGQVVVVSNTGSQLAAYSYGAAHVIWVVGLQKIVKNLDEAMQRINEYTLVKENARVQEAYGIERSNVSKVLIFNKEVNPDRIKIIFVPELIGF